MMINPDLVNKLSTKLSELLDFVIILTENPIRYGKKKECFNLDTEIINDPDLFGIFKWAIDSVCMVIQLVPYPDDKNHLRGRLSYHFKPKVGDVKYYTLPILITWSKTHPKMIHLIYNENCDSKSTQIGTQVSID